MSLRIVVWWSMRNGHKHRVQFWSLKEQYKLSQLLVWFFPSLCDWAIELQEPCLAFISFGLVMLQIKTACERTLFLAEQKFCKTLEAVLFYSRPTVSMNVIYFQHSSWLIYTRKWAWQLQSCFMKALGSIVCCCVVEVCVVVVGLRPARLAGCQREQETWQHCRRTRHTACHPPTHHAHKKEILIKNLRARLAFWKPLDKAGPSFVHILRTRGASLLSSCV